MRVFLTPEELAERWRKSTGTLDNWRTKRVGPDFVRLADKGGPVIYELAEIQRYEETGRVSCDNS